jgi:hypothetical protein
MGFINDGSMHDWNDGDIVTAALYEADRDMLRVAINDNWSRLMKSFSVLDSAGNVLQTKNFDLVFNFLKIQQGDGIGLSLNTTTGVLTVTAIPKAGSIGTSQLADGSVTTPKIADGNVTTAKIADGSITLAKMASGSVDGSKVVNSSIGTTQLADSSIISSKIATNAVQNIKLADSAVTESKISDGAVSTEKIAESAVTSSKLDLQAVTTPKIANGAVGTTQLAAASVTEAKLADNAVTTNKLADGVVTAEKLDPALIGQSLELEAHNADIFAHNAIQKSVADPTSYDSVNKLYKVIRYYRDDNTVYMRSTLGDYDSTNKVYGSDEWRFYDDTGTTTTKLIVWELSYNTDRIITSKTPQIII